MSQQGTIKFFDAQKGFGFITPDEGGRDLFVHRNNVAGLGHDQGLEDGEAVEFDVPQRPQRNKRTQPRLQIG